MHYDENPPLSYDEQMMLDGLLSQYLVAIMFREDVYFEFKEGAITYTRLQQEVQQIESEINYIKHSFQIDRFRKY